MLNSVLVSDNVNIVPGMADLNKPNVYCQKGCQTDNFLKLSNGRYRCRKHMKDIIPKYGFSYFFSVEKSRAIRTEIYSTRSEKTLADYMKAGLVGIWYGNQEIGHPDDNKLISDEAREQKWVSELKQNFLSKGWKLGTLPAQQFIMWHRGLSFFRTFPLEPLAGEQGFNIIYQQIPNRRDKRAVIGNRFLVAQEMFHFRILMRPSKQYSPKPPAFSKGIFNVPNLHIENSRIIGEQAVQDFMPWVLKDCIFQLASDKIEK